MVGDVPDDAVLLSIGQLAQRTGLSVKLIRHWSDIGIVPPTDRSAAGYRRYDARALARLELARTLRDLGLGMAAIRDVLDGRHGVADVAALHADALEVQIRTLRVRCAVLRSVANRGSTTKELSVMSKLARLSAAQRTAIVHQFISDVLADLDAPGYREGLLAATPDLPDQPTNEQVDAWIELAEMLDDPQLRAAMRRMGEYAARHAPGLYDEHDAQAVQQVTDFWVQRVTAAIDAGIPADSPAADPVVADVVGAWLPMQEGSDLRSGGDGEDARSRLLEQLEIAADPRAERYWQLLCIINGWPVRASLATAGQWLMTALRANPAPGVRAADISTVLDSAAGSDPAEVLRAYAQVLDEVDRIVATVTADRFDDPTPCADWNVRTLLNHLVYENLMWTSLAEGNPRADFNADHLGDDHVAAFRASAQAALTAFGRPGMLVQQYGPAPGWRLVEQVLIEMLVHGWDLAKATGRPSDLAPSVAATILATVHEMYAGLPRTPGGSFAEAKPVPEPASAADHVAAYLGRDVSWAPSERR
ncbi:TIGR03086 family metal-binding protein [Dactylosporangium sp. CA-233914]|uniref:TIGR03086 family metal-binding protein n=1 Tax=Dactylosporangium sp. CA-233914 TaxID=3239934 RepID=UPI003D8C78B5